MEAKVSEETPEQIARKEIVRERMALGLAAKPDPIKGDLVTVRRLRRLLEEALIGKDEK